MSLTKATIPETPVSTGGQPRATADSRPRRGLQSGFNLAQLHADSRDFDLRIPSAQVAKLL